MRQAGQHALVRAGYHVLTAADGEEGLRLAREKAPDLIVLDMMLPKLSGEEVLHQLRLDSSTAKTAVMVLTSLPQCNEARLKSDGATSYYQKSKLDLDKDMTRFVSAVELMLFRVSKARSAAAR